jgi:outer membrane protein assembly factor BamB
MHSRLALFLALTVTATAGAQDWTRFRGPNGSGHGQVDLPEQLTEQNIKWTCPLPGTGYSSPVLWGDRIFLTATPDSRPPYDQARRNVACVDAKDGKILWQREFSTVSFHLHGDNSFASPSCTVDSERVYAWLPSTTDSTLVAMEQKDGKVLWTEHLGPYTSQHGPGASPIVEGGTLYLQSSQDGPGSFIAAWDPSSGKQLWKDDLKGGQHASSTPFLYTPPGADAKTVPQLISLSSDNGLLGLDPKTGKKLWSIPDLFKLRCVASPVELGNGYILCQSGQGTALSEISVIKGIAAQKPEKAYDIVRIGGYVPTPVASGPYLYLWKENGFVTCLKADNNDQVWSERVEGPYYASPVLVTTPSGDRLYNITRGGDLVSIAAGDKFRLLQKFPLKEKNSFATPSVSGGRLYVRTFSHLICLGK